MGFEQALSGLTASSRALDVISNNVANSNTVGFKQAQAHFADVFAVSLQGAGSGQIGIGTTNTAIAQQHTQGNVTATNNALDVAIKGGGYFRMQRSETDASLSYTRNGQFHLNDKGYISNDQGYVLTGIPAINGVVPASGTPAVMRVNAFQIAPQATAKVELNLNLYSNDDIKSALVPPIPFNPNDPTSYNGASSLTAYDSEGLPHTLSLYYLKTGTGAWDVRSRVDTGANKLLGQLTFDSAGKLATSTLGTVTDTPLDSSGAPNGAANFNISFDATSITQYGSAFGVNSLIADGYATGNLSGLSIAADGLIQGQFSNGQSLDIGRITLSNFRNPGGLTATGDNQWVESPASGRPTDNSPGASTAGVLQAGAVEDSNVDITAELVNMITMQRAYQANAQSIKTQDSILQTITNLR